ncbi:hypothetical protein ASL14_03515 [Paenibacillus sp. IHB B 3084]|nr:hypothetical protein ASL14_03515 [Paenibacillus sp. IHB B 3084]
MVQKIGEIKGLEDPSNGEAVFEFINSDDPDATKVFDEYCLKVAAHIMNLQYILDPELFAIGGGISAQLILIKRLEWALGEIKRVNPLHIANPKIAQCTFRSDANLIGALYNFFVEKEKKLRESQA